MTETKRPLDGIRIAVVGNDTQRLDEHIRHLDELGAVASPRPMLSELAAAAERCTVVVVFPDEFADEAIRGRVDGLERWHDGPTLVIVTDSPARWTATRERARPVTVVAPSEW